MLVLLHWIEECLFVTHQAICWSECLDVEMLILHTKRFESWRQDSLYLQHLYSYGKSTRSFAIFCGPARANSQARLAIVGLASKKTSLTKLEKYSKILHSHRRRLSLFFRVTFLLIFVRKTNISTSRHSDQQIAWCVANERSSFQWSQTSTKNGLDNSYIAQKLGLPSWVAKFPHVTSNNIHIQSTNEMKLKK